MTNEPSPRPVKREEPSPREQARQAVFAERRTSEDSEEYTRRLRAQARFRIVAQSPNQSGAENCDVNLVSPVRRTEGTSDYRAPNTSQPARIEEAEGPDFFSTPERGRGNRERTARQLAANEQPDRGIPPDRALQRRRNRGPDREPSSPSDSSDSEDNPPTNAGRQPYPRSSRPVMTGGEDSQNLRECSALSATNQQAFWTKITRAEPTI
ncbi:hypothetical protein BC826DRAFT_1113834 [Russula brevipes]|nr:hypothetical protein BC826DRAFT_1113834 [Russula brevipes]